MGGYEIEPILSLISLPTSPKQYGRPFENHKLSTTLAKIIYDGTFVQSSTSLKNEIEEAVAFEWLYKEVDENREVQCYEISLEQYGKGYKIVQQMGYSRTDPLGT